MRCSLFFCGLLLAASSAFAATLEDDAVVFLAVGDVHYGDELLGGKLMQAQIAALNAVPKLVWPAGFSRAGERVGEVRGVILAGDVTDNGSKDQWLAFERDFGLNGDHVLSFPVFEAMGNHDYPAIVPGAPRSVGAQEMPVLKEINARNAKRKTPVHSSPSGGSYSWDWAGVHFVNLGIKASDQRDTLIKDGRAHRETDPVGALTFLKADLKQRAADGRPVVLIQHYPPRSGNRIAGAELAAFLDVIKPYNVIAILHAHTHETSTYALCGIPVFDVGSPHYFLPKNAGNGYFSLFRISKNRLEAASVGWQPDAPDHLQLPAAWSKQLILPLALDQAADRPVKKHARKRDAAACLAAK